jgi:hypothetical protein
MGSRDAIVLAPLHLTAAALVSLGCAQPSDTNPGSILLSSEDPICAGTPPALEEEADRLTDELQLEWLYPVEVELATRDRLVALCEDACEDMTCSCAPGFGETAQAFTSARSAVHEMVHVLRLQQGIRGTPFIEEGVAQALGGGFFAGSYRVGVNPEDWADGPAQLFGLGQGELVSTPGGYVIAGHFFGYLAEEVGEATLLAAISNDAYRAAESRSDFEAWFSDALGLTLEEADDGWRARGYREYARGKACADARSFELSLGASIDFSQAGDCQGSEETRGPFEEGGVLYTHLHTWCVTAPAGRLSVRGDATPSATLRFDPLDCDPGGESPSDESFTTDLGSGIARDVAACTWVISAGSDAESFSYSVELALD